MLLTIIIKIYRDKSKGFQGLSIQNLSRYDCMILMELNTMEIRFLRYVLISLFCAIFLSSIAYSYTFHPQSSYHSIYKPEGKGPFPAILILHGSSGVGAATRNWASMLKDHGYVVYIVDSFKPRHWKDRQSEGWDNATDAQLSDVTPAYQYLSKLKYVDPNHIGILGFSMGGFDVLRIMSTDQSQFKAAAVFYGVCHRLAENTVIKGPTTIFIGANDDRATTKDCKELIERSHDKTVKIKIYAHALHGFDNIELPENIEKVDEKGEHFHMGYDQHSKQLAQQDLLQFFDRYLTEVN